MNLILDDVVLLLTGLIPLLRISALLPCGAAGVSQGRFNSHSRCSGGGADLCLPYPGVAGDRSGQCGGLDVDHPRIAGRAAFCSCATSRNAALVVAGQTLSMSMGSWYGATVDPNIGRTSSCLVSGGAVDPHILPSAVI